MTSCPTCEERLLDLVYGELGEAARQEVEAHLLASPACARDAQGLRDALKLSARSPGEAEPSPALLAGLKAEARKHIAELRAGRESSVRAELRARRRVEERSAPGLGLLRFGAVPLWAGAAAVVLLAFAIGLVFKEGAPGSSGTVARVSEPADAKRSARAPADAPAAQAVSPPGAPAPGAPDPDASVPLTRGLADAVDRPAGQAALPAAEAGEAQKQVVGDTRPDAGHEAAGRQAMTERARAGKDESDGYARTSQAPATAEGKKATTVVEEKPDRQVLPEPADGDGFAAGAAGNRVKGGEDLARAERESAAESGFGPAAAPAAGVAAPAAAPSEPRPTMAMAPMSASARLQSEAPPEEVRPVLLALAAGDPRLTAERYDAWRLGAPGRTAAAAPEKEHRARELNKSIAAASPGASADPSAIAALVVAAEQAASSPRASEREAALALLLKLGGEDAPTATRALTAAAPLATRLGRGAVARDCLARLARLDPDAARRLGNELGIAPGP